jgi:hypothetical protein
LLTSHADYESTESGSSEDTANNKKPTRLNREIQIYQSLPFVLGQIDAVSDAVCRQHLTLIDTHMAASDVYAQLRVTCAEAKASNCDLNIIHLNQLISGGGGGSSGKVAMHLSLASNKYFRRLLGQAILSELLGVKLINTSNHLVSYLPGFNLFQVGNLIFITKIWG